LVLFSYPLFRIQPIQLIKYLHTVGYSLGRSYRVYEEFDKITVGSVLIKIGDDHQQLMNTDFENEWVYQASLL